MKGARYVLGRYRKLNGLQRVVPLVLLLLVVAGTGVALRWQGSIQATHSNSVAAQRIMERQGYTAEQEAGKSSGDNSSLVSSEQYWNDRVTYPTGKFNMSWLLNANQQDKQIGSGIPAGQV